MNKLEFAHVHDVIFETTGFSPSASQCSRLVEILPNAIRDMAEEWSWSDTIVRESLYMWTDMHSNRVRNLLKSGIL